MPQIRITLYQVRVLLVLADSHLLVMPAPADTAMAPTANRNTGTPWIGERGVVVMMEQIKQWDRQNTNRTPLTKRAMFLEPLAAVPADGGMTRSVTRPS